MPTTIAVESKDIVLFGVPTSFQHLYLVKTVRDATGKVLDERVIRGDVGQDLTLVTLADVPLASSPDARGSQTPAQRHQRVLDLNGRDPDDVWSLMVQHAVNIDRADRPYGVGVFDTGGPLEVNSNTTVASVLHTVSIELGQNFPVGVRPSQAPLWERLSAMLVNDVLLGSGAADIVRGGAGNDRLDGNAGDDSLFGEAGNDVLIGRAGADRLNGGIGADVMAGGAGSDSYWVDSRGDRVVEASTTVSAGIDRVVSTIGLDLSSRTELAGVERLTFVGTADLRGSGNGLANLLAGNAGDNVLSGRTGNDVIVGNAGADFLLGGSGEDGLRGGSGDDRLLGGTGRDTLSGGPGADAFTFRSVTESRGSFVDRIVDFEAADRIDLQAIDANALVVGNQSFQWIGAAAFTAAGQLRLEHDNAGNTWIQANVNDGLAADFELLLRGFTGPVGAGDFAL